MKTLDARSRSVPEIAEVVHQLSRDRDDVVTLDASAPWTVVTDPTVTPDTVLLFDPLTAAAATELYSGSMYVLPVNRFLGSFLITHTNSAVTDRTFRWLAAGD